MNIEKTDRIGELLTDHLKEMVFDELSDAYLEKAGVADILKGVPVPIRKTEMTGITVLKIALNMAFVFGVDPGFKYKENYLQYILRNFDKNFSNGLIAINLEEDDRLTWVCQTDGNMNVIMVSQNGKCLKFPEDSVRKMGRTAIGVRSMKLAEGDKLIFAGVAKNTDDLLIVTEKGIGKRTPVALIPVHGRTTGGQNITNIRQLDIIGKVAAALVLHENDDVTFMSSSGNIVRLRGSLIPRLGRTARGVRLVRLEDGAVVAGVTANDADAIPEAPDEQTVTELPTDQNLPPEEDLPAEDDQDEEELEDEITDEEDSDNNSSEDEASENME